MDAEGGTKTSGFCRWIFVWALGALLTLLQAPPAAAGWTAGNITVTNSYTDTHTDGAYNTPLINDTVHNAQQTSNATVMGSLGSANANYDREYGRNYTRNGDPNDLPTSVDIACDYSVSASGGQNGWGSASASGSADSITLTGGLQTGVGASHDASSNGQTVSNSGSAPDTGFLNVPGTLTGDTTVRIKMRTYCSCSKTGTGTAQGMGHASGYWNGP